MTGSSGIGRAALVVSAGILASRVLGFLRNVVLFGVLGLDTQTDLYVAAFSIPDYLFFLMAGGYLSITLVPILTLPVVLASTVVYELLAPIITRRALEESRCLES